MLANQFKYHGIFSRVLAGYPVFLPLSGNRIVNFMFRGKGYPDFHTTGCRDPALLFKIFPGNIVAFRPDKGEYIAFAAVFTDKRGGKTAAAYGLNLRGNPEHRRRQKVHLIINNQTPGPFPENAEMGKGAFLVRPPRENLIGRDRYCFYFFFIAGILADFFPRQRSLVHKLGRPLMDRRDICGKNERTGGEHFHDGHTHHCFSRPAGKHDGTESGSRAFVSHKGSRRGSLIIPDYERRSGKRRFTKGDFERFTVLERRFILYRPAEFEQFLFYRPPVQYRQTKFVRSGREEIFLHLPGRFELSVYERDIGSKYQIIRIVGRNHPD